MQLKILSWNIWVDCHAQELKTFLDSADADIIGLQEVRAEDPERDILTYLKSKGYEYAHAPEQEWIDPPFMFGPAVLSKYPIRQSRVHTLSAEHKRFALEAKISIGNKMLHVFSTHLTHTHQKPSAIQDVQAETLVKLLPTENTIVMGDFNATPDSNAIKKMGSVLNNSNPENTPTWSVYADGCDTCQPKSVSICLDYIFTSKDLHVSSPKVESSKASDHLPISIVLDL